MGSEWVTGPLPQPEIEAAAAASPSPARLPPGGRRTAAGDAGAAQTPARPVLAFPIQVEVLLAPLPAVAAPGGATTAERSQAAVAATPPPRSRATAPQD